jgi:thiol-disulfide isomerase/thioredoxin
MRKTVALALTAALTLVLLGAALTSAAKINRKITQFTFAGPISVPDQNYLGLSGPGAFHLRDIKAPYVLLEIMRTTCPHCVEQVPAMNRLYQLVAQSPLKNKLKFIALGESDHAASLKKFQAAHRVPFAMVPDPDWRLCDVFSIEGTPTIIVVDQQGRVLFTEVGVFENANRVFKQLKARLK